MEKELYSIQENDRQMGLEEWIMMRVLILGGVAAGTKVAAKLKRLRFDAEVLILTKDADISYAGFM